MGIGGRGWCGETSSSRVDYVYVHMSVAAWKGTSEKSFAGVDLPKFRISLAAKCPRGKWGVEEDKTAVAGNSLRFESCRKLGVGSMAMDGIKLASTSQPSPAVLRDYPSVLGDREVAAPELDRSASLGKLHWRKDGS